MKEFEKKLQEFQTLIGKDDAKSERMKAQIVEWLEQNGDDDAREKCKALVLQNLKRIDEDIATIRQQIATEYDILPISYIAKHYFKKSASWLHQRINGYCVRGKVYTLNEEQKQIFNNACKDIAKKIGSLQLT